MTKKKDKKKIKLPEDGSIPDELYTNPDEVFKTLLDDIKDAIDPSGSLKKNSKLDTNPKNKTKSDQDNSSEIHISGRIDNFLFGAMKDPYFQEFQNSNQVFNDLSKTKENFLESFFSLFLEINPFENKTNLEIFNESVDVNKLKKFCPHFYNIYQTILPESLESKEIVNKDFIVFRSNSIYPSNSL